MTCPGLTVLSAGPLTLVQDLGRPGLAVLGVGRSGAADRSALRLANRLVGNDEGAAGLEVLLGGLRLRADQPVWVAVTGARCPLSVDGAPVGHAASVRLVPGQVLALGPATTGLRAYVGVRGGLDLPAVLGSLSYDLLAGLGPLPLRDGDLLPVGRARGELPSLDQVPLPAGQPTTGPVVLPVTPGPRQDWLVGGLADLLEWTWTVSADSDRIGLRLTGPPLRRRPGELATEGLLPGAVQVPPDGQPVLFLTDAPVTGGYPVVAIARAAVLDLAAQLRPGDTVRFA